MKIARLGIAMDPSLIYYLKQGDVWAIPRGGGSARKIAAAGIVMDYAKYLYYVDDDGDVSADARVAPVVSDADKVADVSRKPR